MTTNAQASEHRAHLEELCAEGGPLTAHSRHATTQNPEWFNVRRQQPRQERRALHNEILAAFVASKPEVLRNRKAIVLAGPPGVGKSTAQSALIAQTRTRPDQWLSINPDDFKDDLLMQALADGSYESYMVPDEVRELESKGEEFYPRELAALVHNESSILAKKAIRDAIGRGDNIVIDGTLSGEKNARAQMDVLQAAGYDVKVADVETTQALSEARTLGRWERGYLAAENGTAVGRDAELGGRWVPLSFPASLFAAADDRESICAAKSFLSESDRCSSPL
ncbi:zeta toxin family protein [Paenarthrobacter sp. AMU7]|uniref:UDP-N-acetylglucosamine kinase n=1 Tax=Paenarthrobacter sp. AMU7 TaxID=3162492 RepID=A0AB39YSZ4_9MICC